MLKYDSIIKTLTLKQKIRLISDILALSDEKNAYIGIPVLKIERLDKALARHGVSLQSLANSWDTALIEEIVYAALSREECPADIYICPSPKPYLMGSNIRAMSEDTYLQKELTLAVYNAVHKAGSVSIVDEFWLTAEEIKMLDKNPSMRFAGDVIFSSFLKVLSLDETIGAVVAAKSDSSDYGKLNASFAQKLRNGYFGDDKIAFVTADNARETISSIKSGCILLRGSSPAIEKTQSIKTQSESANYLQYEDEPDELIPQKAELTLTGEEIDEAVDRLLNFAFKVKELKRHDSYTLVPDTTKISSSEKETPADSAEDAELTNALENSEENSKNDETEKSENANSVLKNTNRLPDSEFSLLMERSVFASSVLLKNENAALPLKSAKSVALIGAAALGGKAGESFVASFEKTLGHKAVGVALGYEGNREKNLRLITEAKNLAKSANSVLVFLETKMGRTLPLNQLILLDALSKYKEKITVIIHSADTVDMSFDDGFAAIVISPKYTSYTARALAGLLTGRKAFSGRLAKTFHSNTDEYFANERSAKIRGEIEVGIFLDYKRLTGNKSIKYPFGFGQNYCQLKYTASSTFGTDVTVTVTNTGSCETDIVLSLYMTKNSSKISRPKAELCAFKKIHLLKGKSQKIQFRGIDFKAYDEKKARFAIESGNYTVSIGDSSFDLKLPVKLNITGSNFESDNKNISDFVETKSNIAHKKYYLEAKTKDMKTCKKTHIKGTLSIFVSVLLLISIAVCITIDLNDIINISIGALAAFTFILGIVLIKRASKQEAFAKEENKQSSLNDAKNLPVASIKDLFEYEFKEEEKIQEEIEEEEDESPDIAKINDLTPADLASFRDFAANGGISITANTVTELIPALLSSRLILAKNDDENSLEKLISLLSDFCGGDYVYDALDESYTRGEKLLTVVNENGVASESVFADFIKNAQLNLEKPHFIILDYLTSENAAMLLSPYIRYFENPNAGFKITVGSNTYYLPKNLWFIADYEERAEALPRQINELAAYVHEISLGADAVESNSFEEKNITITALHSLAKKARESLGDNENLWKKLDALEDYVFSRCGYRMGNRFWLKTENYFASALETKKLIASDSEHGVDADSYAAMDYTLANSVMPTLYSAISRCGQDEIKNLFSELERNFGEDKTPVSKNVFTKED